MNNQPNLAARRRGLAASVLSNFLSAWFLIMMLSTLLLAYQSFLPVCYTFGLAWISPCTSVLSDLKIGLPDSIEWLCSMFVGEVIYILRPVLIGKQSEAAEPGNCATLGTGRRLQVPGFGVQMAIKDMEYSALDDKKVPTINTLLRLQWYSWEVTA